MKKSLIGIMTISACVLLASCNKKTLDYSTFRSDGLNPSATDQKNVEYMTKVNATKDKYNLNFNGTTGVALNLEATKAEGYKKEEVEYNVYLANDYANSVFAYKIKLSDVYENLDKAFNDNKIKTFYINTLVFSESIYDEEKNAFVTELYNDSYGLANVKDEKKKFEFSFNQDTTSSWTKSIKDDYVTGIKNAYKDNIGDIYIKVAYLPAYLERYHSGQEILSAYFLAPIYVEFVDNSNKSIKYDKDSEKGYKLEDSKISCNEVKLEFAKDDEGNAKNYLATNL